MTFFVTADPQEVLCPRRTVSWQTCPRPGQHCMKPRETRTIQFVTTLENTHKIKVEAVVFDVPSE